VTDPLAYLTAALAAAEAMAHAAIDDSWQAVDTPFGPTVRIGDGDGLWSREGQGVEAAYHCDDPHDTCTSARHGYLAEAQLIAEHASPAAVLRRIAAERKLIACHQPVNDRTGWRDGAYDDIDPACATCGSDDNATAHPCRTITALAEAWGWTPDQ